jgi:hypothetical protein
VPTSPPMSPKPLGGWRRALPAGAGEQQPGCPAAARQDQRPTRPAAPPPPAGLASGQVTPSRDFFARSSEPSPRNSQAGDGQPAQGQQQQGQQGQQQGQQQEAPAAAGAPPPADMPAPEGHPVLRIKSLASAARRCARARALQLRAAAPAPPWPACRPGSGPGRTCSRPCWWRLDANARPCPSFPAPRFRSSATGDVFAPAAAPEVAAAAAAQLPPGLPRSNSGRSTSNSVGAGGCPAASALPAPGAGK